MGACRRYPELLNKHENDWCGEYQSIHLRSIFADIKALPENNIQDCSASKTDINQCHVENKETSLDTKDIALPKKRGRKKIKHD